MPKTFDEDIAAGEITKAYERKTGKTPPLSEALIAASFRTRSLLALELERIDDNSSDEQQSAKEMHDLILNLIGFETILLSSLFLIPRDNDNITLERKHFVGWLAQVVLKILDDMNGLMKETEISKESINPLELNDAVKREALSQLLDMISKRR
jgi:hypothetical protein